MDKITKNIINGTIKMKFYDLDSDFSRILDKSPELARKHNEFSDKVEELSAKLEELLPEQKELIDDLVSASLYLSSIESQVYFKEGATLGCTELNYLSEAGLMLNFI